MLRHPSSEQISQIGNIDIVYLSHKMLVDVDQ